MKLRCLDMRIEEIKYSHIMCHLELEVEKGFNAKNLLEISVNFAYETRKNIITQNKRSWDHDDTIAQKMSKCFFVRAMHEIWKSVANAAQFLRKTIHYFWDCY